MKVNHKAVDWGDWGLGNICQVVKILVATLPFICVCKSKEMKRNSPNVLVAKLLTSLAAGKQV